jgi:hypothetical protein
MFNYDFNNFEVLPEHLLKTCDFIVVDPPFITGDVWTKYAATAKLLCKENAKVKVIRVFLILGNSYFVFLKIRGFRVLFFSFFLKCVHVPCCIFCYIVIFLIGFIVIFFLFFQILVSSVLENFDLLRDLLSFKLRLLDYKPGIPNLVYQYSLMSNFDPVGPLKFKNDEIVD